MEITKINKGLRGINLVFPCYFQLDTVFSLSGVGGRSTSNFPLDEPEIRDG